MTPPLARRRQTAAPPLAGFASFFATLRRDAHRSTKNLLAPSFTLLSLFPPFGSRSTQALEAIGQGPAPKTVTDLDPRSSSSDPPCTKAFFFFFLYQLRNISTGRFTAKLQQSSKSDRTARRQQQQKRGKI